MDRNNPVIWNIKRAMLSKKLSVFFSIVVVLGLSSCATLTAEQLIAAGAIRLDAKQTKAHISGKTEKWPYYATYYGPDGKVEAEWNKVRGRGTWEVSADGIVCLEMSSLGKSCHFYLDNAGAITMILGGVSAGVKQTIEGKSLR
jgi:hypothetical protein